MHNEQNTQIEIKPKMKKAPNGAQKNVIELTLSYYLDDIIEKCIDETLSENETYEAFNLMISKESLQPSQIAFYQKKDVLSSIEEVRKIIDHPHPENRSSSYTSFCPEGFSMFLLNSLDRGAVLDIPKTLAERKKSGCIYYKNGRIIKKKNVVHIEYDEKMGVLEIKAKEVAGVLSLTNLEDDKHLPVTKQSVVKYIRKLVNSYRQLIPIICDLQGLSPAIKGFFLEAFKEKSDKNITPLQLFKAFKKKVSPINTAIGYIGQALEDTPLLKKQNILILIENASYLCRSFLGGCRGIAPTLKLLRDANLLLGQDIFSKIVQLPALEIFDSDYSENFVFFYFQEILETLVENNLLDKNILYKLIENYRFVMVIYEAVIILNDSKILDNNLNKAINLKCTVRRFSQFRARRLTLSQSEFDELLVSLEILNYETPEIKERESKEKESETASNMLPTSALSSRFRFPRHESELAFDSDWKPLSEATIHRIESLFGDTDLPRQKGRGYAFFPSCGIEMLTSTSLSWGLSPIESYSSVITEAQAEQLGWVKAFEVRSAAGARALSIGVTVDQLCAMSTEHVFFLLDREQITLDAIEDGVITLEQISSLLECKVRALNDSFVIPRVIKALREGLISIEKINAIDTLGLIDLFYKACGLTALKENLITLDQINDDSIRPKLELIFTENGLRALREQRLTMQQVSSMSYAELSGLSDRGFPATTQTQLVM